MRFLSNFGDLTMIEKDKNKYNFGMYENQLVLCECGNIVTVWLNVNGEGKAVCDCKCEIKVERKRRSSKILIFHDDSHCQKQKSVSSSRKAEVV